VEEALNHTNSKQAEDNHTSACFFWSNYDTITPMTTPPSSATIAKNTGVLTIASIVQKVFAFVYFTIIARIIGPEQIGMYVFAVSFTTLLAIGIDLGATPTLIREIARDKLSGERYLNTIITAKVFLSLVVYAGAVGFSYLVRDDTVTREMIALSGLVMIFDSFTLTFWGVFRGLQVLKYEGISIMINQALILLIGITAVVLHLPLIMLIAALLTGSFFSFIFSIYLINTKTDLKIRPNWSTSTLKALARLAAPFALAGIFTRMYSYIDQVLLSILIGDKELGWYSVAYKITFALQFIPTAFAAAIYPAMSNYYQHAKEKLTRLFEESMYFLMLICIPASIGIALVAPSLITTIYGTAYEHSILPLQILILALPAVFLSFPVGSALNSTFLQHINTTNLGLTMVLNIILNILLIPPLHHVGAAIAATISLYFLFISNLLFVKRTVSFSSRYLW